MAVHAMLRGRFEYATPWQPAEQSQLDAEVNSLQRQQSHDKAHVVTAADPPLLPDVCRSAHARMPADCRHTSWYAGVAPCPHDQTLRYGYLVQL
jgi:hypothetical protein